MNWTVPTLGFALVVVVILFFVRGQKWKRTFEEMKKDRSSEMAWGLIQQQFEQLRGQINEGQTRNISLLTEQLRVINDQVNQQLLRVNQQLQNSSGQIGQRLDTAAKVIGEVRENIGRLSKSSDQIYEVGKNIASLQEILRPPKLRGGLGEHFWGELLAQILPPQFFTLQHQFLSGGRLERFSLRLEQIERQPSLPLGKD